MPLIAVEDSLLVVVDLQPRFWGDRLDADDLRRAGEVAARGAWLAGAASALGVPAVLTEEEPERNGPTDAAVLAALQPRAPVFTKPVFGLADCPDIMAAIGFDRILFSSDYPHWDYDDARFAFKTPLTDAERKKIFNTNARAVYKL